MPVDRLWPRALCRWRCIWVTALLLRWPAQPRPCALSRQPLRSPFLAADQPRAHPPQLLAGAIWKTFACPAERGREVLGGDEVQERIGVVCAEISYLFARLGAESWLDSGRDRDRGGGRIHDDELA